MHRIRITALAVSLLLAAVAMAEDRPEPRTPVTIDSRPEHAEILLNGEFIGTTPLSYRLPAGEHKIVLVRANFESWARQLTVGDTATKVVALMQPNRDAAKDCSSK